MSHLVVVEVVVLCPARYFFADVACDFLLACVVLSPRCLRVGSMFSSEGNVVLIHRVLVLAGSFFSLTSLWCLVVTRFVSMVVGRCIVAE